MKKENIIALVSSIVFVIILVLGFIIAMGEMQGIIFFYVILLLLVALLGFSLYNIIKDILNKNYSKSFWIFLVIFLLFLLIFGYWIFLSTRTIG